MGIARQPHPLLFRVHFSRLLQAAAIIAATAASAHAGNVTTALEHRGQVDWTRGMLVATGASAADVRAPTPDVARVRSERKARDQARARLLHDARALAWAEGGTVGAQADASAEVAARLDRAVDRARDESVDYSSDGTVVVRLAVPLEAIRAAVAGASAPPADAGVTAVVVRVSKLAAPQLGLVLQAGGEAYAGPTVFYRDAKRAAADARAGDSVVQAEGVASKGAIDVGDADVATWRKTQPLVIVVLGKRGS